MKLPKTNSLTDFNMTEQKHYIVDCFPYFNEKEILELRVNLLKDHVDKFIVVDSNRTHGNVEKEYSAKRLVSELNLPSDKIEVIELDMRDGYLPPLNYYDHYWGGSTPSRDRVQRDAIYKCLETNDFSDDTVFIVGDCDEVVDPKYIKRYKQMCLENPSKAFKIPLVYLQGRANLRTYYKNNQSVPAPWNNSLYFCSKNHLEKYSLSAIRSGFHKDFTVRFDDAYQSGWHFSWMGSNENRLLKSLSFSHFDQELTLLKYGNYANEEQKQFMLDYDINTMEAPCGYTHFIMKEYPCEELPEMLFDLPRVKEYLLPE